jgi:hypothetical protein
MKSHVVWLFITITLFLVGRQLNQEINLLDPKIAENLDRTSVLNRPSLAPSAEPGTASPSSRIKSTRHNSKSSRSSDHPPRRTSAPLSRRFSTLFPAMEQALKEDPTPSQPTLSKEQIEALVQATLKNPDPIIRRLAFDKILTSLDESTALAIRSALARNKAGGEQWRLFDYAWSAGDPTVVQRNLPNTAEQHQKGFISNSLPGWAFADPVSAAQFVNDYEPGPLQDHFRNRVVEGLADNDIGMATDFVLEIANDDHPKAPQYIRTIARKVIETQGPSEVQIWANTLPEGPLRNSALSTLPKTPNPPKSQ